MLARQQWSWRTQYRSQESRFTVKEVGQQPSRTLRNDWIRATQLLFVCGPALEKGQWGLYDTKLWNFSYLWN